jgi:Ca-activated chloride channel family protein
VYVDSEQEASQLFGQRFDSIMEVAARSVQIKVTVPWYFQVAKFFGEQMSQNPKEVEPQHLAPGTAMVINQVLHACDAKVVNQDDPVTITVNWQWPLNYQAATKSVNTTVGALLAGPKTRLVKGKAILAYAEAVGKCDKNALASALTAVEAANTAKSDPALNEIAGLIAKHPCQ